MQVNYLSNQQVIRDLELHRFKIELECEREKAQANSLSEGILSQLRKSFCGEFDETEKEILLAKTNSESTLNAEGADVVLASEVPGVVLLIPRHWAEIAVAILADKYSRVRTCAFERFVEDYLNSAKSTTDQKIKKYYAIIKKLSRQIAGLTIRNLRLFYRTIIRSHFKNLDDNSGSDDKMLSVQQLFILSNLNYQLHVKKGSFNYHR